MTVKIRLRKLEQSRRDQQGKPGITFRLPKMINDLEEWTTKALAQQEAAKKAYEAKIKGATP